MTDQEAAAWTRGHAVGERELKAAEQRWQVERAELKAEVEKLREAAEQALGSLKSCSGVPHWPALQQAITAIDAALKEPK